MSRVTKTSERTSEWPSKYFLHSSFSKPLCTSDGLLDIQVKPAVKVAVEVKVKCRVTKSNGTDSNGNNATVMASTLDQIQMSDFLRQNTNGIFFFGFSSGEDNGRQLDREEENRTSRWNRNTLFDFIVASRALQTRAFFSNLAPSGCRQLGLAWTSQTTRASELNRKKCTLNRAFFSSCCLALPLACSLTYSVTRSLNAFFMSSIDDGKWSFSFSSSSSSSPSPSTFIQWT